MTPFEEELYRLIQDIKTGTNPFTSAEEDTAVDVQHIANFAKKWDFREPYLQVQTQLENVSKKIERERGEIVKGVSLDFIKEIIPIMDSSSQLVKYVDKQSPFHSAVYFILEQFQKILQKRDGGVINPKCGDTFNPTHHLAVTAERTTQHKGNLITEVLRCGYLVNGQVVRPAEVRVSIGSENST